MTNDELKAAAAVMLAAAEGKPIQLLVNAKWLDTHSPSFNWQATDYRIKPIVIKYRRYLLRNGYELFIAILDSRFLGEPSAAEKLSNFVRWIDTEWQEEDVQT